MIVIGAGMSGLLAAAVLRNNCEAILEAQPELPANHSAVLRFKSSVVGDVTNIPFKKVKALKSYVPWLNPVADVMAYSNKSNGDYRIRSIVTAKDEVVDRWVAPPDFTKQLADRLNCPVSFNTKVSKEDFSLGNTTPMISTLPMPFLMDLLGYTGPKPEFRSIPGVNILCKIHNCQMYASLYIPDPAIGPYRISINGDQMISEVALLNDTSDDFIESCVDNWHKQAQSLLGIPFRRTYEFSYRRQALMKILPIDSSVRERFIIWASDMYNVHSLGRFATWRPEVLLDDIVNDIRVIQRLISIGSYEQRRAMVS